MPANVQTMAYYGEVHWHGLGTKVPNGVNAEQMIQAAGLDWKADIKLLALERARNLAKIWQN